MGIPRLKQDLAPFREDVILGPRINSQDWPCINKVVIDGPSLVHFIYHRLLSRKLSTIDAQPSYREIASGVIDFLLELEGCGVDIQKIYFDGALPVSKRGVRVERLETARRQLEAYCATHHRKLRGLPSQASGMEDNVLKSRHSPSTIPVTVSTLPAPPFMVPSVIEDLKHHWTSTKLRQQGYESLQSSGRMPATNFVEVVDGEADAYCAEHAKTTGAAILSNDSDLALYDLGPEGSLIFLDSLKDQDVAKTKDGIPSKQMKASCLRPAKIARRMQVTTLKRVAFDRYRDQSASATTIRSHARTTSLNYLAAEQYKHFCSNFDVGVVNDPKYKSDASGQVMLDTRVSELWNQYQHSDQSLHQDDTPHMYLPLIIEDHDRESSWEYGLDFRTLAYSLLNLSAPQIRRHETTIEFRRRGRRIAGLPVGLFPRWRWDSEAQNLISRMMNDRAGGVISDELRLFAFKEVRHRQRLRGKPETPHRWIVEFLSQGYVNEKLSWDDIQIYANIQAVLYSIRILKQITAVTKSFFAGELGDTVQRLNRLLEGMPPLTDLVPSRGEIHRRFISSGRKGSPQAFAEAQICHHRAGEAAVFAADPPNLPSRDATDSSRVDNARSERLPRSVTPERERPEESDAARRKRASDNIFELLESS